MDRMRSDWIDLNKTGLIAHRCGGALAPENSLAGLDASASLGIRAVEFDVMLSRDGVPILIHDDTLDRTTDAHGPVVAYSAAQLASINCAKGWTGRDPRFAGETIPSLGATLQRCGELGLLPNIEIKPYPGQDEATGEAAALVARSWAADLPVGGALPLLSSFSEPALLAARAILPHWPCALLFERVPGDWRVRVRRVGASALHCDRRQGTWDWLDAARADGVAVRCYTVNRPQDARSLWARGIAGVFSDRPDLLRSALADFLLES